MSTLSMLMLVTLGGGTATADHAPRRELLIFQAASLTNVFERLASSYEKENLGVKVLANSAGSQQLRAQIEHGASADVFASADRKHMDALAAQTLVLSPAVFACNEPVVVVRAGFAPAIRALGDLPRAERIVVGASEVPIGAYTQQIFHKASAKLGAEFAKRIEARIVSRELNVRQVLAKVVLGEADAGVVYRSDAMGALGKIDVVQIPADVNVIAEYTIAVVKAAPQRELARRWIDLVKSPEGVSALRDTGFVPCSRR